MYIPIPPYSQYIRVYIVYGILCCYNFYKLTAVVPLFLCAMFRYLLALALTSFASGFTTLLQAGGQQSHALSMTDFSKEVGAQLPLGFFDPLGLMTDADAQTFKFFRDIETKHGRVSMLAVVGHEVTTAGVRLPGAPFSSMKTGLVGLSDIPLSVLFAMVSFIGLIDIGFTSRKDEIESVHLQKSGFNDALIRWNKGVELNNGRAAMMGITALMAHEKINNDPYIINTLFGFPVPFNQ